MQLTTEKAKVAHLLRRFGLGASEAEVDYYGKDGFRGAVDRLLDFRSQDEGFDVSLEAFRQPDNNNFNIRGIQQWWVLRILSTRRPLQEKMTLFWHDHFATSASKVNAPLMMYQQNELLRKNGTGKFRELLLEASKDPAMVFWLDNQFNVRGKPNENFAREIMELFTLGVGHYSETDIQEAARAFTGWSIRRRRPAEVAEGSYSQAEFLFVPRLHDTEFKTILENKGPFRGEDVIDILCGHPQTPVYLTKKLWEWFVYPNPEAALVERFAGKFQKSGLDVGSLLKEIMLSSEFVSEKAVRAIYKNPVDFCVPTLRQLGIGEATMDLYRQNREAENARRFFLPAVALQQGMAAMGMDLMFPPDVAGWDGGQAWISTATMVERISWADRLFGVGAQRGGRARAQVRLPAFSLFSSDPSPRGVVDKLLSVFDAELSEEQVGQLVAAAEKASEGRVTAQNANQVAAAVSRLIFGSPEFQMA
ncbi:MAG: hypothetical protein UZ18_ATM001001992 [Armatimonadetes bacterium OLB18]|nr:MAG: hypothetical protein UZ18_ATM001001992 [Armatimonadetes bacterium OLB18]